MLLYDQCTYHRESIFKNSNSCNTHLESHRFRKMRDQQPAVLHINLCVSLLGFYIAFLSSERAFEKTVRCAVASAAIHYFCLATVMWMTMEAVNMYRMLIQWTKGLPNMRQFVLVSCLVGYGNNSFMVSLSLITSIFQRFHSFLAI